MERHGAVSLRFVLAAHGSGLGLRSCGAWLQLRGVEVPLPPCLAPDIRADIQPRPGDRVWVSVTITAPLVGSLLPTWDTWSSKSRVMREAIWLLAALGTLGAFDTVWFHEVRGQLVARPEMRPELRLHVVRDALYVVVFATLPHVAWHGVWAALIALVLLAESS